jgi:hypothetical protein
VTGVVIRFIFLGIEVMVSNPAPSLAVQIARFSRLSTLPAQSFFEKLYQSIDQPLLPADDVEATLVAVLL